MSLQVGNYVERLVTNITPKGLHFTDTVHCGQVSLQRTCSLEACGALVAIERLPIGNIVNCSQMRGQIRSFVKRLAAHITTKRLEITNSVNSSQVDAHIRRSCERSVAQIACVLGIRPHRSQRRSFRGVLLSERCAVAVSDARVRDQKCLWCPILNMKKNNL